MVAIAILLDDVGAEVGKGEISFHRITFRRQKRNVVLRLKAIRPVAVENHMGGTAKGAAWGYLLAGPLGAAAGSLLGAGAKVTFELDTEEGETLRCVVGQAQYPGVKRKVEAAAKHWGHHRAQEALDDARRANGEHPVSLFLGAGIALLPPVFAWFVLRKGTSLRARLITGAYVALWLLIATQLPSADQKTATATATAKETAIASEPAEESTGKANAKPSPTPSSTSSVMSFEDCNRFIALTADQLGQTPINIVDSNIARVVRFRADDGSVLITCSRPDRKMIVTPSSKR